MLPFLFVAAIFTSGARSDDVLCVDPVPGLHTQARGIDVTSLDMMPIDPMSADSGYRGALLKYTCNSGAKRKIDGIVYDQPDQVWIIQELPAGALVSSARVMTKSEEVRESMNRNSGVELAVKKFTFSNTHSFSTMQSTLNQKEKKTQFVSATFSGREVELLPMDHLPLGPEAQESVDKLPLDYVSHQPEYESFIQLYGTHYMESCTYGGLMQTYQETNTDYYETHNEQEVANQASAGFDAILVAKGGSSSSTTEIDKTFTNQTSVNIRYYGGSANLMAENGIAEWQPTISANPWAISAELKPIYNLIRDSNKAKQMETAVNDYIMFVYMDVELKRILKTLPDKVQVTQEVTDMLARIDQMKNGQRPYKQDEVELLGEDVQALYVQLFKDYYNQDDGRRQVNDFDQAFTFSCPASRTMTFISSWHHNHYEDRRWTFGCSLPDGLGDLINCAWTADYVNGWDANVDFVCPGDSVMKGWSSYHDNHKEDRRFKFMCCDVDGAAPTECSQTDYKNTFDGDLNVEIQRGVEVFTGTYSVHDNHYEDRRFKFTICKLKYYDLPERMGNNTRSGVKVISHSINDDSIRRPVTSIYELGFKSVSEHAFDGKKK